MTHQTRGSISDHGRPVELTPSPPGLWKVLYGVAVATLAPLFGFLFGVMAPRDATVLGLDSIAFGLAAGIIVGGVGITVALFGGVTLYKYLQNRPTQEDSGR